jgi:hypothetical protein
LLLLPNSRKKGNAEVLNFIDIRHRFQSQFETQYERFVKQGDDVDRAAKVRDGRIQLGEGNESVVAFRVTSSESTSIHLRSVGMRRTYRHCAESLHRKPSETGFFFCLMCFLLAVKRCVFVSVDGVVHDVDTVDHCW